MTVRCLAVVLLVLSCRSACAQLSASDVRQLAQIQNQHMADEARWNQSKKLTLGAVVRSDSKSEQPVGMNLDEMTKGQVGFISHWQFSVGSIIDENNVLLNLGSSRAIWLQGYPTRELVSDARVCILDPVEVGSTKSYVTALGTERSVRVVRILSAEEQRDLVKAEHDAQFRTFHSTAGTTVDAKFIRYGGGRVHLETKDGRSLALPLSVFAEDDANYLRAEIKATRK